MVDTGIMTISGQVVAKAGANINSVFTTYTVANVDEARMNQFILEAENLINSTLTYDFSAVYSTLTAQVKNILNTAASAWAAMRCINYDPDAIGRSTSTLKLNVLKDEYNTAINELKNKNTQDFMIADT